MNDTLQNLKNQLKTIEKKLFDEIDHLILELENAREEIQKQRDEITELHQELLSQAISMTE